jgi:hypothetical protein
MTMNKKNQKDPSGNARRLLRAPLALAVVGALAAGAAGDAAAIEFSRGERQFRHHRHLRPVGTHGRPRR